MPPSTTKSAGNTRGNNGAINIKIQNGHATATLSGFGVRAF